MTKRIHKTLENVETENEFESMHAELAGSFATYEDTLPTGELEEFENWNEADPESSCGPSEGATEKVNSTHLPSAPVRDYSAKDRPEGDRPKAVTGPTPAILAGVSITLCGFVLTTIAIVAPTFAGPIMKNLGLAGLTPGLIVSVGIVILTLVAVARRQNRTLQAQMEWVMDNHEANAEILDCLIETAGRGRSSSSGEELQQVQHSLLRQDEKINNITKALKMYGKPLVDINRQAADNGQKAKMLSTQIGDLRDRIDGLGKPHDLAPAIEGMGRKLTDPIHALEAKLEGIGDTLIDPITCALAKASKEGSDEMMKAVELFSEQVVSDVSRVVSALPKALDTDEILQTLRRELGQLNETIARVQAAAPAGSGESTRPDTTRQAMTTAPAATPTQASTAGDGPAQPSSGTAKSSGKAVLGAIAKLKRMR